MHSSDRQGERTGAAHPVPAGDRPEVDRRALLLGLVLLWPGAAALPVLTGAPPVVAIPWVVAATAGCVRWAIFPRPAARRAARRGALRAAGLGASWPLVLAAACITVVIAESWHLVYARWHAEPASAAGELWEAYARRGPGHAVATLLLLSGIVPLVEELALRGLAMRELEPRLGAAGAVAAVAVVFAALHASRWAFPQLLAGGVVLGAVAWGARSVWASVVAHGTWNAFAFSERFWPLRETALVETWPTWLLVVVCLAASAALATIVRRMRRLSDRVAPSELGRRDG